MTSGNYDYNCLVAHVLAHNCDTIDLDLVNMLVDKLLKYQDKV